MYIYDKQNKLEYMPTLGTKVSQARVFGDWLKYEYESRSDFRNLVDTNFIQMVPFIINPDFNSQQENEQRLSLLLNYRWFVKMITDKTEWYIANIDESDMRHLRLINSGDWRYVTSGSLNPIDAAKRIDQDSTLQNGRYDMQINYILDNYERLTVTPSRPIIVGPMTGPLTVIDGVHRIVSYSLFYFIRQKMKFEAKEVYLGITQFPFEFQFS